MDKKQFTDLCIAALLSAEVLAEKVMEYDIDNNNTDKATIAENMRDDYIKLRDRMSNPNFDIATLDKTDFSRILIAANCIVGNFNVQIENMMIARNSYNSRIIPMLTKVVNSNEEEFQKNVEEIFH